MLTIISRTSIVYLFIVLALRLLGKRQIGELEPSELVAAIIISEVAAMPIQDTSIPLINSFVVIGTLLLLEILISYISYKSMLARKFFYGRPSIFFEKGKIHQKEMKRQRFNLNDLMECVRNNGITGLDEVDYVIMETNGNVSVIPKPEARPVSVKDAGLKAEDSFISYVIIDNGYVNKKALLALGFNENWLKKQLSDHSISSPNQIFCMTADRMENVIIIPKKNKYF